MPLSRWDKHYFRRWRNRYTPEFTNRVMNTPHLRRNLQRGIQIRGRQGAIAYISRRLRPAIQRRRAQRAAGRMALSKGLPSKIFRKYI